MSKAEILLRMDGHIAEVLFQTHDIVQDHKEYVEIDENLLHEMLVKELQYQRFLQSGRDPVKELQAWIRDVATAGDVNVIGAEARNKHNTVKLTLSIFRCGLNEHDQTVMSSASATVIMYYNKNTGQAWTDDPEFSKLIRAIHSNCPSLRISYVVRRASTTHKEETAEYAATEYSPQVVAAAVWNAGTGLHRLTIEHILEMVKLDADVLISTSALYYRPVMHSNILIMVVLDGIRSAVEKPDKNIKHISLKVLTCKSTFERQFSCAKYNFANSIESIDSIVNMYMNEPFALVAGVTTIDDTVRVLTWSGMILSKGGGGLQLHRLTRQENMEFNFSKTQNNDGKIYY